MYVTNCIMKSDSGLEWKLVIIKCRGLINDSTDHKVRNKLSHLCKQSKQQNFLHLAVIHFSFASLTLFLQPLLELRCYGNFSEGETVVSLLHVEVTLCRGSGQSPVCVFGMSRDSIVHLTGGPRRSQRT